MLTFVIYEKAPSGFCMNALIFLTGKGKDEAS